MSNMNFNCDVCGREVYGCAFVNGMKFCAKCYQETFGETEKDRKIIDLQSQLAEKEKEIEKILKENERLCIKYNVYTYGDKIEQDKIYAVSGEALEFLINEQNQKAIEQLEKVKKKILSYEEIYYQILESGAKIPVFCVENFRVRQTIDNQIKQLKEMK